MALTDRKLTIPDDFAGYEVSSLDDEPTLSASELKQRFDASMESVMAPAFNSLIDDLVAVADGASGADGIGCTAVGSGTAETVQESLEEIYTNVLGWVPCSTLTYVSATSATVSGDLTLFLRKNTKIRYKQGGGYKYNNIISEPSYNSGTGLTTITTHAGYVTTAGDCSFSNAAITDFAFSNADNPVGFADNGWFNFAPARAVSGGTTPTYTATDISRFKVEDGGYRVNLCWTNASGGTAGAGAAASVTFQLPIPMSTKMNSNAAIYFGSGMYNNGTTYGMICTQRITDQSTLRFAIYNGGIIYGDTQNNASRSIEWNGFIES